MQDIPQRLYDSEINFSISCFWDGGFTVKLGDDMNGFDAETQTRTYADALAWLDQEARKRYPGSLYATGKYPEGWRVDGETSAMGAGREQGGGVSRLSLMPNRRRRNAKPAITAGTSHKSLRGS